MRLAFSVATARRPDVLIVDEALSVGDAYFQHKSFDRIREFRKQGTTLLIVSHDKQAIQSICDRAILLNVGRLAMKGEPEAVMDYYNAMLADRQNQTVRQSESADGKVRMDSGTLEAEIINIEILNTAGQPIEVVAVGENVRAKIEVRVNSNIDGLVLGFGIKDRLGQMVFGTNTFHTKQRVEYANAGDLVQFNVYFSANLGVGSFSVHCSLVRNDNHVEKNYHWIDRAKVFEVINVDKPLFAGCAWNELVFEIIKSKANIS
jgi:lipopolysaccharide transport system ATP-binding protein